MDPFELLKSDHDKVSELFERIEGASDKAKASLFKQIQNELEIHTQIEETILYPALKKAEETRDITLEAYEEHRVVKELLAELAVQKPNDKWNAKLTVLKENVEHHVDEEENDMFPKAKDVLSTEEAETLGDRMAAEKRRMGSPVPEEAKPGVIKRVVNALFGSSTKKASKKKGGKKKAASTSTRATAAKRTSQEKSASKKKTGTKKAAKKATRKSTKKTSTANRGAKPSASKQ